jgi:hypothetical protein
MDRPRKLDDPSRRAALLAAIAISASLALAPHQADASDLASPPEALATDCRVSVTGPLTFTRSNGKPQVETIEFSTPDAAAPHILRADNGGLQGELRPVKKVVGVLNSRRVLGPPHFSRRVHTLEEAVEVLDENRLLVQLKGKPDSGVALEVFAVDAEPPELIEVFPADGSVVSEPQVTLVVTLDDALSGAASVTCAGIEATPVEDQFACTVPLAVGPNPIELVAADACGNESVDSVTITFDPPPVVAITSPDDGDVILRGPIVVSGNVDDPAATVTVNGVPASGAPVFTATVPVRKGANTLTAVARDAAGGEGADSVDVTVLASSSGPTTSISSPKTDFLLGGPRTSPSTPTELDVEGRIRADSGFGGANPPEVAVNGVPASTQRVPSALCSALGMCDWNFDASLTLTKAGNPHSIEAVGTDRFDQSDVDSITGNIDECVDHQGSPSDADGLAIVGDSAGQSNRCHEIDGCSTPEGLVPGKDHTSQDPTAGTLGRRSTAFGKDSRSEESHPHGMPSMYDLPCNHHDICYQTCGADRVACDDAMYTRMVNVCRAAYPEAICPYGGNVVTCALWRKERDACMNWALSYRVGLRSREARDRFDLRQAQYCWP